MKRASLLLAFVCACSGAPRDAASDGAAPSAARAAHALSRHDGAAAAAPPLVRARRALQVREVVGKVERVKVAKAEEVRLAPGSELVEAELVLERDAHLRLSLGDGVAIRVLGPGRIFVAPEGEPALLLAHGTASVDVAPAAHAENRGFWLADAHGRYEALQAARFVVDVRAGQGSALAVISGDLELRTPAPELVRARETKCVGSAARAKLGSYTALEAAEQALHARPLCSGAAPEKSAALRSVLDEIAQANVQVKALLAQHAAKLATDAAQTQGLRQNLAERSSALLRTRERGRALRAMGAAEALSSESDDLRVELARARALVPYTE